MTRPFLLEVGVEEMPAQYIDDAREELRAKMEKWLSDQRLSYSAIHTYSTPRRLSVLIEDLTEKQSGTVEEARGPAVTIAKDEEGQWTKAALGFARGQGVEADQLVEKETSQGSYVFANIEKKGEATIDLLPEAIALLTTLTFPKSMRWGREQLRYVRPIRWLVALFGDDIVPYEIAGVKSGRESAGHRFLGETVSLPHPRDYEQALMRAFVLVNPEARKDAIRKQLEMLEEEQNWRVPGDEDLLQEVTNLVEYPTVLYGTFAERYLQLPDDVLITTMREHQRYFAVRDTTGHLLPYFVTVRNGDHRYLEQVQKGNEKVLRARLADAVFFYEEDQARSLDQFMEKLEHIVEREQVGSLGDKQRRTVKIARELAVKAGFSEEVIENVTRAAQLLKFDLSSNMVDEFPELQGIMGADYAFRLGEKEAVATAIKEQYLPRFNGDELPGTTVGLLVSMADKWDTIMTSLAIGLTPTGSQDPHGLRRQAQAIVQMANRYDFPVPFETMLSLTVEAVREEGLTSDVSELSREAGEFFALRFKALLGEEGVAHDVVNAVLIPPYGRLDTLFARAAFLQEKHGTDEMKEVAEAFGRVNNIAKKVADEEMNPPEPEAFEQEAERELYSAYVTLKQELPAFLAKKELQKAWETLVRLTPTIHRYFDGTMVMSEDDKLRTNRLRQMQLLSREINRFARFQSLVIPS
ncbi:glycine--tRNA ligase subunit beta [Natribacillus halophilus]|uniref:Glycine--tRNA ligase beta subunit n=1 Tax=Natribacillus halophilus TaxID=549003 RepID=A0A1G8JRR3_9BACI|nr:glycine--tRNA ligase subunit beta [Natribacillus halophilus]SDI33872.1 glycyl-tRNA synthetase beta chain [Natribacillus halophilus]